MGLLDGTLDRNAGANYDKPIAIMMFPTYITLSCNLWGQTAIAVAGKFLIPTRLAT